MFCDIIRYVDYYSITLINRQHGGSLVPKLALTVSMSSLADPTKKNNDTHDLFVDIFV